MMAHLLALLAEASLLTPLSRRGFCTTTAIAAARHSGAVKHSTADAHSADGGQGLEGGFDLSGRRVIIDARSRLTRGASRGRGEREREATTKPDRPRSRCSRPEPLPLV